MKLSLNLGEQFRCCLHRRPDKEHLCEIILNLGEQFRDVV